MLGKLFAKKLSFLRDNRGIAPLFILVLIAAAALAVPITAKVVQQSQPPRQTAQETPTWSSNDYKCSDGDSKIRAKNGEEKVVEDCGSKGAICTNQNGNLSCQPLTDWCKAKGIDGCYYTTNFNDNKCKIYRGYKGEAPECRPKETLTVQCYPVKFTDAGEKDWQFCYSGGEGQICYNNYSGLAFCGSSHLLQTGEDCKSTNECALGSWCSDSKCKVCLPGECKDNNVAPTPTPTGIPTPTPTTALYSCVTHGGLEYKCASSRPDGWTDSTYNPNTTCKDTANPICYYNTTGNLQEPTSAPTTAPGVPTPTTKPGVPGASVAPKPTPNPGTPCTNTGEMCGKGDRSNVPNTCTYGNTSAKDTWCQNTTHDNQTYCYSCSASTTPVPTNAPAPVKCDSSNPSDQLNNCGNANYGYLGTCNGTWSYGVGNAAKDNWCRINAGGTRAYCYTCTSNPVSTPPPAAPTVGAGTPTPTTAPSATCPDVNSDGSRNACRASCQAGETDQGPGAGQACSSFYGSTINKCCKLPSGGALGPSCQDPQKKCDLSKNQAGGANSDCSGCGAFCVNTGVYPGFGQCIAQ